MPAKKKTAAKDKLPDFESALQELETLVEAMESGELSLEQSMQHFERGITLTRNCQKVLQDTEQKVRILMQKAGGEQLTDFDGDD